MVVAERTILKKHRSVALSIVQTNPRQTDRQQPATQDAKKYRRLGTQRVAMKTQPQHVTNSGVGQRPQMMLPLQIDVGILTDLEISHRARLRS